MRCYSRCCEVNECSCSNVEDLRGDEPREHDLRRDQQQDGDIQVVISESLHQHHQHHSHTPENNDDELDLRGDDLLGCNPSEHGVCHDPREHDLSRERGA